MCSAPIGFGDSSASAPQPVPYKELTLAQLRCLAETARTGSFAAAAVALGVAFPTVWKQVRALERGLGARLVEPHGRGCHLTDAGRQLLQLAEPSIEALGQLASRFRATQQSTGEHLTVAGTPRVVIDDLIPRLPAFRAENPTVRLTFTECNDDEVAAAVHARRADLGFTPQVLTARQTDEGDLIAEAVYTLEVRLLTPARHPLAAKRTVRPKALAGYPLVNSADAFSGSSLFEELARAGLYQPQRAVVRAGLAASLRALVRGGFGIALIPAIPGAKPLPGFHERPMRKDFADIPVYCLRRGSAFVSPAAIALIEFLRGSFLHV